ncbi:hypothetical protein HN954_01540 [bacterium]|jgi:hypothetical protein|nr:hypothetical protein [bacterium]MBT6832421.1 hypothetical protein [bacterium]MBT6996092.1 hypothetical protein [bacterium]MBT7772541.1 hypothetical protein [bacterium]
MKRITYNNDILKDFAKILRLKKTEGCEIVFEGTWKVSWRMNGHSRDGILNSMTLRVNKITFDVVALNLDSPFRVERLTTMGSDDLNVLRILILGQDNLSG